MAVYYVDGCGCCACSGSVEVYVYYSEGANYDDPWELSGISLRWYNDQGVLKGTTALSASSLPNLPTQFLPNQRPSSGDTLSLTLLDTQTYNLDCGVVSLPSGSILNFTYQRGWGGGADYYYAAPMIVQ